MNPDFESQLAMFERQEGFLSEESGWLRRQKQHGFVGVDGPLREIQQRAAQLQREFNEFLARSSV